MPAKPSPAAPRRRGKQLVPRCLLALLLVCGLGVTLLLIGGAYLYHTTDYSMDEQLFAMAKGNRTTRFFYAQNSATNKKSSNKIWQAVRPSATTALPDDYVPVEWVEQEIHGQCHGLWCDYAEIPANLKNAFVAIEDHRFFAHEGVDWLRTGKAALNQCLHWEGRFGGSTITQQLIKNISSDDEISFSRKAREICRAIHLERSHSKEEILELYLNIVPLSQGCVGVGAAAQTYYGKEVGALTLEECAALAGITNAPGRYDPIRQPENHRARRDLILSEMAHYGYISEAEAHAAQQRDCPVCSPTPQAGQVYNWYIETVLEDVIQALVREKGMSRTAATELVYQGGLSVYTAMDPGVQAVLDSYFSEMSHLPQACRTGMQMAMVVVDPASGDLLGIYGAAGKKSGNRILNYAQTLRAPGSALKPLSVYAPALEEGIITWGSVFDDVPLSFIGTGEHMTGWPHNTPAVYSGLIDLPQAVAQSKNTVAVRILHALGKERAYSYLSGRLGLETLVRARTNAEGARVTDLADAPLALGQLTDGVSLRALTTAYDALAGGGVYHHSRSYVLVLDGKGEVLLEDHGQGERVFSANTACIMTELLRGVVSPGGTAQGIRLGEIVDVAGKTGTSGESRDKYFVGYTPYLVAGIWCGYPRGNTPVSAQGGVSHLDVWAAVMTTLHQTCLGETEAVRSFTLTPDVCLCPYCRDSGGVMTDACRADPRGVRESVGYFVRGTEPHTACDRHCLVSYDVLGGGIAQDICPAQWRITVGLLHVEERDFPIQVYITDAQYVYRDRNTRGAEDGGEEGEGSGRQPREDEPFFAPDLPPGHYAGLTRTEDGRQYNAYCRALHDRDGPYLDDRALAPWWWTLPFQFLFPGNKK